MLCCCSIFIFTVNLPICHIAYFQPSIYFAIKYVHQYVNKQFHIYNTYMYMYIHSYVTEWHVVNNSRLVNRTYSNTNVILYV